MAAGTRIQESGAMRSATAWPAADTAPRGGHSGAIVHVSALQKTFGDLEAIHHLSFDVADGEFLSVLGPSGCGKSTLLMMIAGLIGPSAGEIRIKDMRVVLFSRARFCSPGARCCKTCCFLSSC